MKCPVPRRVCFSGDTEATSSTTLSMSPSNTGSRYSDSLDALMIAVPGSGTLTAIDAVGGCPDGSHGGGIRSPTSRAGGARRPPQAVFANSGSQSAVSGARIQHFASMLHDPDPSYWAPVFANSGSQYEGFGSCSIDAKCWMRAPLTAVPANLGSVRAPTIRSAS